MGANCECRWHVTGAHQTLTMDAEGGPRREAIAQAAAAADGAVQGAGVGPALVAGPATAAPGPGPTHAPGPAPRLARHGGPSPSRHPDLAPGQSPSPAPEAALQPLTKAPSRGQDPGADPSLLKITKRHRPEEKLIEIWLRTSHDVNSPPGYLPVWTSE